LGRKEKGYRGLRAQANALALLKRRTEAEWDLAMGPYWGSLPAPGSLLTKEMVPAAALPLLQDGTMVLFLLTLRNFMKFYCGTLHLQAGACTRPTPFSYCYAS
jgi:hypothetical protein